MNNQSTLLGRTTLMRRVILLVDGLVDRVAIALFLVIFAAVLAQIVMRYAFDNPLVWSEELSRYLFIWIALLGWTLASRNGSHITVQLFLERMPRRLRLLTEAMNAALTFGFCAVLMGLGIKLAAVSADVPTITLFFNFAVVYAAVPVTAAVIMLYSARTFAQRVCDLAAGEGEVAR